MEVMAAVEEVVLVVAEEVVLVVQSRPEEPSNIASLSAVKEATHAPQRVRAKDEAPANM